MQWIVMETSGNPKLAKWKRTAGVDDDGMVYLPIGIFNNPTLIVMNASWDGVTLVVHGRHLYCPVDRLIQEAPHRAADLRVIAAKVLAIVQHL